MRFRNVFSERPLLSVAPRVVAVDDCSTGRHNSQNVGRLRGRDPVSISMLWILSRPERSGCGNGLPNPVTGAHAVKSSLS
jgi:hypothetical protein